MIALIKHSIEIVIDGFRFAFAVWHDARVLQHEAEKRYGQFDYA